MYISDYLPKSFERFPDVNYKCLVHIRINFALKYTITNDDVLGDNVSNNPVNAFINQSTVT